MDNSIYTIRISCGKGIVARFFFALDMIGYSSSALIQGIKTKRKSERVQLFSTAIKFLVFAPVVLITAKVSITMNDREGQFRAWFERLATVPANKDRVNR